MTKNRWLVAASAFSILTLAACEMSKTPEGGDASVQGEAKVSGLSKLARIEMTTDTSYLTGEEREVVNLLIQASDLMSEIYKRQTTPNYDQLRAEVVAKAEAAMWVCRPSGEKKAFAFTSGGTNWKLLATWNRA